jgi:hypothetical protein
MMQLEEHLVINCFRSSWQFCLELFDKVQKKIAMNSYMVGSFLEL